MSFRSILFGGGGKNAYLCAIMKLKNILFYSFFIITSTLTCTLATTDRMQETLTQEASNQLKNKKASFYEYDFVTYLCTYKFRSFIFLISEYLVESFIMMLCYEKGGDYIHFTYFVSSLVLLAVFTILRAAFYRYGVNSFTNRFLFWFKQLGMRAIIPLVSIFISFYFSEDDVLTAALVFIVFFVHSMVYILIWDFPEKAKSILYRFSNKFPKAKGTSK